MHPRRRCRTPTPRWSTSSRVSRAVPHFVQSTAGIGTPHARWREMHQSGRCATMLYMRSCPQAGIHFTSWSIASSAVARSVRGSIRCQADLVECDEPLGRREKDHRVVAAPAVRVLMGEGLAMPEPAALLQRLFDLRIRVEHPHAAEELDRIEEVSGRSDRRVDVQARTSRPCGSRRRRGRARYGRRPCLPRASRTRRGRRANRARRADGGTGCLRAPRPSSARRACPADGPRRCRPLPRVLRRRSPPRSRCRPRHMRRNRTPDETRPPGSTESSTALSSR